MKLVHDWAARRQLLARLPHRAPRALLPVAGARDAAAGPARPSAAGLVLIAGSIAMLAAGRLGAELFLTRLALLGTLAGMSCSCGASAT